MICKETVVCYNVIVGCSLKIWDKVRHAAIVLVSQLLRRNAIMQTKHEISPVLARCYELAELFTPKELAIALNQTIERSKGFDSFGCWLLAQKARPGFEWAVWPTRVRGLELKLAPFQNYWVDGNGNKQATDKPDPETCSSNKNSMRENGSSFSVLDSVAGHPHRDELLTLLDEQQADDTDIIGVEHWRCVRADSNDDSGGHSDDAAGDMPASPKSCLHRLAQRVTASRPMTIEQHAKIRHERATFGIASIIAGKVKRKGRPSKAEMMERARRGL